MTDVDRRIERLSNTVIRLEEELGKHTREHACYSPKWDALPLAHRRVLARRHSVEGVPAEDLRNFIKELREMLEEVRKAVTL